MEFRLQSVAVSPGTISGACGRLHRALQPRASDFHTDVFCKFEVLFVALLAARAVSWNRVVFAPTLFLVGSTHGLSAFADVGIRGICEIRDFVVFVVCV